jgi:Immunoglobulin-like domain of bacterial spore germination
MRPIRSLLAVVVVVAVALAGCSQGDAGDASGGATAPAASPTSTGTGPAGATATTKPGSDQAVAAGRQFLRVEVGMDELVAGPFKATGADTGQVGYRLKYGEGGRPMPATAPQTTVRLRRYANGWAVTGTSSSNIRVSDPIRFERITSPVAVAGKASAFEGTVQVRVTEDRAGKDRTLGRGVVTGSGTAELGPFSGRISFGKPSADAGWVLFYTESEADGVGILEATSLRIRFGGA